MSLKSGQYWCQYWQWSLNDLGIKGNRQQLLHDHSWCLLIRPSILCLEVSYWQHRSDSSSRDINFFFLLIFFFSEQVLCLCPLENEKLSGLQHRCSSLESQASAALQSCNTAEVMLTWNFLHLTDAIPSVFPSRYVFTVLMALSLLTWCVHPWMANLLDIGSKFSLKSTPTL